MDKNVKQEFMTEEERLAKEAQDAEDKVRRVYSFSLMGDYYCFAI